MKNNIDIINQQDFQRSSIQTNFINDQLLPMKTTNYGTEYNCFGDNYDQVGGD